jgi:hypothetical protein
MNTKPECPQWDERYYENQRSFPPEELAKYYGRHVAYSWDGASIVANGESYDELQKNVKAAGLDPGRVVYGYVDDPEVSFLGWF